MARACGSRVKDRSYLDLGQGGARTGDSGGGPRSRCSGLSEGLTRLPDARTRIFRVLVAGLRGIGVFGTGRRLGGLRTRFGWRAILAPRCHSPRERRVAPGRVDVSHGGHVRTEERPADSVRGHAAPRRRHALSERPSAASSRSIPVNGQQRWAFDARVPRERATAISPAAECPCGGAAVNAASSSQPSTRASSPRPGNREADSGLRGAGDGRSPEGAAHRSDRVCRLPGHLTARDRGQHRCRGLGHRRRQRLDQLRFAVHALGVLDSSICERVLVDHRADVGRQQAGIADRSSSIAPASMPITLSAMSSCTNSTRAAEQRWPGGIEGRRTSHP